MKKKMISGILATLLISLVIFGSFAWFYINENTYVDFGSDILCEAGESLEISDDGGATWSGVINKEGFSTETVDITGDGLNFFRPIEIDESATPTGFVSASALDEDGNGDYIDIKLKFRSTSGMSVYLSGDSFIKPKDPTKEGNIYGNFSRDYIAGATRVAFVNNDAVRMIWAPNPAYELTGDKGNYTFSENGSAEPDYYYTTYNGTDYVQTPFSNYDFAASRFVAGSTEADSTTAGKSARLATLTLSEDGFYYADLTVRIWFEGTDREASEALAGGKVAVKLKFTGIDKAENETGRQSIEAITYENGALAGLEDGMIFSYDGISWEEYSSSNQPDVQSNSAVYFKYAETNTHFGTTVKEISISN